MEIGVLRRKFSDYSSSRLIKEINKKDRAVKLNPKNLCLFLNENNFHINSRKQSLDTLNVVIPRFGKRYFNFGMICVKHLEKMGIPVINSYESIELCRNKYLTSVILEKRKIPQPNSVIAVTTKEILRYIKHLDMPLIFKLIDNSYGIGVSKINNKSEAEDWLETMRSLRKPLYIQEYIHNSGEDYRAFVIGKRVSGIIKRIAKKGQWKTNVYLGAKAVKVYNKEVAEIAIKCAEALKVDICGVDVVYGENGPKVIEVNQFAEFKGLETATGKNIAGEIIKFSKEKVRR